MVKVNGTSGSQRLLSLVQRSLGNSYKLLDKSSTPKAEIIAEAKSADQLAKAASRAGIEGTLLVDTSGLTLEQRAKRREQLKSARKQYNIEKITEQALNYCVDNKVTRELDFDWFNSFIAMAEDISSAKMQLMWAKILAKEIANPGTFSMKALHTLKNMTTHDADMFLAACALLSRSKNETGGKIIYGYYKKPSFWAFLSMHKPALLPLSDFGLDYPSILSLMDAGILFNSDLETAEIKSGQAQSLNNNGKQLNFVANSSGLILNFYKLTSVGHELSLLVGQHPNQDYLIALEQLLSNDFQFTG